MNTKSKILLGALTFVGASLVLTQSASAFGGVGRGRMMKSEGREGLVPFEMRQEFREEFINLSEEERLSLREERQLNRETKRAEMEEFTGMAREEMREAHKNGESVSDILSENGVTQESAEEFLAQRANDKIGMISERHDLSDDQTLTLYERVGTFVSNILGRWFN